MSKELILALLLGYFVVLILISFLTSKKADNDTFYTGNRNNPWYVVAFGMIGASLSGVTFISIPGTIAGGQFTYLQVALGYILGYAIIAFVLLPLYYRLNLTSIYGFLEQRFGVYTYKMGAAFFILSRLIGAALRMYLVANVLQTFVFDELGVPFELTVAFSILLIWVYTFRGGIKTIIWTDTLQTLFMLISVGLSIYLISDDLNIAIGDIYGKLTDADLTTMWQTKDPLAGNYWWKGVIGGMFITLGMTGVDQDMMQKNLSCKNIGEAKKNMISMSLVLFLVNVLFVALGGLLVLYIQSNPGVYEEWVAVSCGAGTDNDLLFAVTSLEGSLGIGLGIFFMLGLVAAAYSSADSALTSLTTSLSIDFLGADKKEDKKESEKIRKRSHIIMSVALLLTIVIFKAVKSDSVIWELFKAANYTYGPLLGLFLFGIFSKRKVKDILTIPVSILVPLSMYFVNMYIGEWTANEEGKGYAFGSELLGINAALVYIFLWIFSKKGETEIN
ncbi:sodium:solute symporter [Paracrocinitomix mangrovi]|uniref:sodium:solute symporter n=1 Tax=Paracrocinitomix mangrovi TaxID=2862509 RepID=UPI001C8E0B68|nr:sodium:solute symporter [Paracrocinitomix mangrovi]UKN02031.1 sodium:solute symporter [Paracrocinitomix mangrovi]